MHHQDSPRESLDSQLDDAELESLNHHDLKARIERREDDGGIRRTATGVTASLGDELDRLRALHRRALIESIFVRAKANEWRRVVPEEQDPVTGLNRPSRTVPPIGPGEEAWRSAAFDRETSQLELLDACMASAPDQRSTSESVSAPPTELLDPNVAAEAQKLREIEEARDWMRDHGSPPLTELDAHLTETGKSSLRSLQRWIRERGLPSLSGQPPRKRHQD